MRKFHLFGIMALLFIFLTSEESTCNTQAVSTSGVSKATIASVQTNPDGLTVEQDHVQRRIKEDNKPGAIKHLYIISAFSGDVMLYSTVEGKVTSSGKRLSPSTAKSSSGYGAFEVRLSPTQSFNTDEVLGDDGTYGSSNEYIFWWDSKGIYHQQYITGGMIVHVSSQPIAVKSVILNLESSK
jgi:hypothetical protein